MKSKWIFFIALRYIFRKKKKSPSPVFAMLGIATGVMTLIVIIAVMNGFQLSFIESILEISSYHLRIGQVETDKIERAQDLILTNSQVQAVMPFNEFQALLRGRWGGQQAVLVRALRENALSLDQSLADRMVFEQGAFDIKDKNSILLGSRLARKMMIGINDEVNMFSIPSIFGFDNEDDEDENEGFHTFIVTGIFTTGYYEYDSGWAVINIDNAVKFTEQGPVLGIKISNHFNDQRALNNIRDSLLQEPGYEEAQFSSWRDYNRSFFGALRTEKLFMFLLVGLIFIVLGLNIFQSQRRSVLEHREEIGLLKALGVSNFSARLIFGLSGAIIGFIGALTGVGFGLLISLNISGFFTVIETVVNNIIYVINLIIGLFDASGLEDISFFSPAVFYIKEIPSRIINSEVVLIFMFGFLSALFAAWFASRRISRTRPAEVLRYE